MLELRGVEVGYGRVPVLKGISLELPEGQIVTLIGSNGAGKTTTLKTITGILRPHAGTILFDGRPINGISPVEAVSRGIALVPEGRRIFASLSVQENLRMGAFSRADRKQAWMRQLDGMFELFPHLAQRRHQLGGTLSGGEQQMLAIARALMSNPRLLLLDEPSMGLAPLLVEQIFAIIRDLNRRGATVLLVEQNARMALSVASVGYVMEIGSIVLHDTARRLLDNPQVQAAYLGI
ncbi:MAG: ABC transporter ATP-binding protein [Candidatus Tectomicrobia bacterium]|nr:ABC transporter ATP-binding protein [Candidatus Tectomicrobia bacterium]